MSGKWSYFLLSSLIKIYKDPDLQGVYTIYMLPFVITTKVRQLGTGSYAGRLIGQVSTSLYQIVPSPN